MRHATETLEVCIFQEFMMLERAKGIEPSYAAWEAAVLPLNYARVPCRMTGSRTAFICRIEPMRQA